jgi:hypothetical protein
MQAAELYWAKVAAIGQIAGAVATFLAVAVSLWIAYHSRKPRVRLKVNHSVMIGGMADGLSFLVFEVANLGERPVYVRGIGWRTGWLPRWPECLARKAAVQMASGAEMFGLGSEPPYEILPGASVSSFCPMDNMIAYAGERKEPLFTRDWPLFGRQRTRIRGYAYTADGHTFYVKPEETVASALADAEKAAVTPKIPPP